jgi:hypothetical protein
MSWQQQVQNQVEKLVWMTWLASLKEYKWIARVAAETEH